MGLTYYDPKPEEGIVINFGNSETGMGNKADGAQSTVQPQQQTPKTQEKVENTETEENPVQTQDVVDAPSVDAKSAQKVENQADEQPKEPEKPKPSNDLTKLLDNVSNSKDGGEGENEGVGDQGKPEGDPNSLNRTGGGGGGGNGNYQLGNRKPLEKPEIKYEPCIDEGRVVVKIYVDRNGKVSRAMPGEKIPGGVASTTTSKCLFDKAKSAALRTTWQADNEAPILQTGYIIYNFYKS